MPRPPRVTRTIKMVRARVLCMDLENGKPCERELTAPARECRGKDGVYKMACRALDSPALKVVQVLKEEVEDKLMGMLEEDFIQHAKELESRDLKDKDTEDE